MIIPSRRIDIPGKVQTLWRQPGAATEFSTAVSLHSHTSHSRESLDFIPRVFRPVPPARIALQLIEARRGKPVAFERAYWKPPLHPHAAFDLEAGQIRNLLKLRPLVSITDHDCIEACADLRALEIPVPYSTEWTVPWEPTVFHIGVHNLPASQARSFAEEMAQVTRHPSRARIAALLTEMHAIPEVLLVFNHPYCNEQRCERQVHIHHVMEFLNLHQDRLHALELNGLQPASDNREIIQLAAERNLPVISGGDRHCTEPNANVNLTNAESFDEFVDEIRKERRSNVLFLPQYRDPIPARYIEFIWQAVRDYPDFTGLEHWADRVFCLRDSGAVEPLSKVWGHEGPAVIRMFVSVVGWLASPGIRPGLRAAFGGRRALELEGL